MEVIKHTDASFIIKDDAKTTSFSILGLLVIITVILLATITPFGIITLSLTGMYLITGYLSRTYIFDKTENTFTLIEITFFKTHKKQYPLDTIRSILFVAMLPLPYGLFPSRITLIRELARHTGTLVHLKTGQKVSILPSTTNMLQYLLRGDLVGLNESEANVGKALAEFLHVPFEVKEALEKYSIKGPSNGFIKFLLKIVLVLLLFLAIFVLNVLLAGIVDLVRNFF